MKKHTTTLLSAALATVVLAASATAAYAGNGNGNGGDNSHAAAAQSGDSASPPGSSGDSPGQQKKAEQGQAPVNDAANTGPGKSDAAPGRSGAEGKGHNASSAAGVKPSNTTSHNVYAAAGSNSTKLYGSGRTAGQIAMQNGVSADSKLYGPGNSQPHKVVPCGSAVHGKGGGFDVHALKSHARKSSCGAEPPPPSKVPGDPSGPATVPSRGTVQGSVAGVVHTASAGGKDTTKNAMAEGGVLSALEVVGEGTLPFTGLGVWAVGLVALALVGLGLTLRRQARVTA